MAKSCIMCQEEEKEGEEMQKCSGCAETAHSNCIQYYRQYSQNRQSSRTWKCTKCARGTNSPVAAPEGGFSFNEYAPLLQAKFLEGNITKSVTGHFDIAVGEIKGLISDLANKVAEQNKRILVLEKEKDELLKKADEQKTNYDALQSRVDDLEQQNLALNLEIHGVPEIPGENLNNVAQDIADTMGVSESTREICEMYRGRKMKNKPRAIVIKFSNAEDRESWLSGRKTEEFRNYSLPAAFSQVAAIPPQAGAAFKGRKKKSGSDYAGTTHNVKIFEQLTFHKRTLLYETTEAAKGKFKFVWARGGKIFARKDENTKTLIRINNRDDIVTKIQTNLSVSATAEEKEKSQPTAVVQQALFDT